MGALVLIGTACADAETARAADSSYTFTTFAGVAGTVVSSADGTGTAAQFSAPRGVAVDGAGNVYVADSTNHAIRKIDSAGVVTTLAGTAGSNGNQNGTGAEARFNEPFAVAVDSAGNVFVADTSNNAIRKITPAGVVTTLAGGNGAGTTDGTGTAAKFHEPRGIAIDSAGTLYVADYENHMVRKVTSEGVVTTLAGGPDISGYVDGQGTTARFTSLQGIAVDSSGNVYVTEGFNRDVRKISSTGLVTTLASGTGKFGEPRGIAVDASGNLYVGDYASHVIRKVTSSGTVTVHAGTAPTPGTTDGTTATALFYGPSGVAIDSSNNLYVADTLNNTVRKISSSGTVTTFAGLAGRTSSVDGSATAARFEDPYAIAVDGSGNLYVADATDNSIRKITSAGAVSTLAGLGGSFGSTDDTGTAARFKGPLGIAADSAGNVYVADTGNATVRKITAAGVVSTLAGSAGQTGSLDASGAAARFMSPYGITVDSSGTVYVVESTAAVRKITAAGVVTTLAGTSGANGYTDATGAAARFSVPFDIAADGSGNLYVSDHGNHVVRKITSAGVVTTLAGSGSPGKVDATGAAASFTFPSGLAADSAGSVYLADTDNQVIRKITADGVVTTIGGTGSLGSADGVGTAASFYNPKDVAVDASGNLYVVDRGNHTIRKGTLAASPTTQTITFGTAPSITVGTTGTVTATATSGLAVTFTSTTASTCSVSGSTVTGITAGTCIIAADQAGNSSYAAAAPVTQQITIGAAAASQSHALTVTMAGSGYGDISSSPSGISCYVPMPGVAYLVAPDCTQSLASGTSVTLTAIATSGSRFTGWSGACTGSSSTCTVGMTEATNVTATFANTGTTSDCVFNWAETAYPQYFPTGAYSATATPYYYRYYATTATYLAISSPDNSLWVLGPVTGNSPLNIGPLATFTTMAGCSSGLSAPSGVALAEVGMQTVGSTSFASSSKLLINWTAPSGYTIDHYEITATESLMNTSVTVTASAPATSATVTPLKASTSYSIVVKACKDSACASSGSAAAVSATTPGEYWQLQGTGNSVSTLTSPVSDGNARLSATRFGPEAGAAANTVQFYYGPLRVSGQSMATSGVVSSSDSASYLSGFTSYANTSGVRSPTPTATSGIKDIMTGQGVPLSTAMGAKVRLFFESNDADGKTRIYSVDSADGYVGRDFNLGAATTCSTSADYLSTGSCPATVVIGVQGDTVNPTSKISAARQNKIGWPTLTDWRWDGAVGTFMVYTFENVAGCNTASHNHAYAVWNGTNFVTQFDSSGCPKMFRAAQAALPMHIGDARYKMYFGDPSITTGKTSGSTLPFVGPKKLIYADGRSTSDAGIVDYEDWEGVSNARDIAFLWPNGDQLSDTAEGYIDDFHFLTPTGSVDIQVLYLSITDGSIAPISATAVLLNP
jgi:hypothetical protein